MDDLRLFCRVFDGVLAELADHGVDDVEGFGVARQGWGPMPAHEPWALVPVGLDREGADGGVGRKRLAGREGGEVGLGELGPELGQRGGVYLAGPGSRWPWALGREKK